MKNNDKSLPAEESINDNLDAAVDASLGSLTLDGAKSTGASPGAPADKGVLVRVTELVREDWKAAAAGEGLSLSEFVRVTVARRVDELLNCSHPVSMRQSYPWSETCLSCGVRLRG
jgi:predicted HicB family RNase H-like nuclease